jgi:hypothetical protein
MLIQHYRGISRKDRKIRQTSFQNPDISNLGFGPRNTADIIGPSFSCQAGFVHIRRSGRRLTHQQRLKFNPDLLQQFGASRAA